MMTMALRLKALRIGVEGVGIGMETLGIRTEIHRKGSRVCGIWAALLLILRLPFAFVVTTPLNLHLVEQISRRQRKDPIQC